MFINKEVFDSEHYNRSLGIDGNFRLTPEMDINAYVAKTATPGKEGDDLAARAAWSYDSRTYQARIAVSTLQDNFNPEVGFAPPHRRPKKQQSVRLPLSTFMVVRRSTGVQPTH